MNHKVRYVLKICFQMVVMAAIFSALFIVLSFFLYGKVKLI